MKMIILFPAILGSLLIGHGFYNTTSAQNAPGIQSFIPPSPNSASLGKYGEIPANLYNGIPEINIPLYTVKARGVELPVSLSYHAGGIKVEEIASWVGLGWSMGAVITRSVRGIPDDFVNPSGYFTSRDYVKGKALEYMNYTADPLHYFDLGWGNGQVDSEGSGVWITNAEKNLVETEPDIFYFNFGSYSGKFFMDENGSFVTAPLEDLKIEIAASDPAAGVIRWKITTPDGVVYVFGISATTTDGTQTAVEKTYTTEFTGAIITTWHLIEVSTPYNDVINLYYAAERYSYDMKESETINVLIAADEGFPEDPANLPNNKKISQKIYDGVRLTGISSATSNLTFTPGSRVDLPGCSSLQSISIVNNSETLNKKIAFSYSYFESYSGTSSYYKRLRLDYIQESAEMTPDVISGGKHSFEYSPVNLPAWNPHGQEINSQDLWGYYNGQSNAVLTQSFKKTLADGRILMLHGAKRNASEYSSQAGILQRINYPTGGFTEFQFESNTVWASDADFDFLNVQTEGKSQFLVLKSGDVGKQLDFAITNPDPLTVKVIMHAVTRQQVQDCPSDPSGFPTCCNMYLEGINGTYHPKEALREGISSFPLLPGTYRMSGVPDAFMESQQTKQPKTYYYNLNWDEYPPEDQLNVASNKAIGGLRIKRIINQSATGNISIKKYDYNLFGTIISSGVMVNFPQHYARIFSVMYDPGGAYASLVQYGTYLQVRSYPLAPMFPTKSSSVGYANVTEYSGEYGENGKTEYVFTTANDYPDVIKNFRPFPQPISYDWRRGLLKSRVVYQNENGTGAYKKITSLENNYTFNKTPTHAYGYVVERETYIHSQGANAFALDGDPSNFYIAGYKTIAEFYYKQQEINRTYNPPGGVDYIETSVDYEYGWQNGHYQLITKTERNSDNSVWITENKYPNDADPTLTVEEETARNLLVSKFMKAVILGQNQTKDGIAVSKSKNRYKVFNSIPLLSSIDLQIGQNPNEQRVLVDAYDSYGNILHQKKISDVDHAYVWGYDNTYPIAEVVKATNTEIAHTSFESSDPGNWEFTPTQPTATLGVARTGSKYLSLSGSTTLSKSGLSATSTYFVSYWSKNGSYNVNASVADGGLSVNGWTYYEHKIVNPSNGTITLNGTGDLDELRLYPKDAQMTTYTYDPAVGITAMTDANNVTIFYKYDLLGRLITIRDNDLKILKNVVYHYKGE